MESGYEALTKFVREEIVDVGLKMNVLSITRSTITSITRRFAELGWSIEPISGTTSRHRIVCPGGNEFLSMVGGKVYRHPEYTEQICRRKHLTKRMLDLEGLPMPTGGDFLSSEKEIAAAYFEKMPKPAVVKPTDSGGSMGVTVGVHDRAEFEAAWQHALDGGRSKSNVLVEQFVRGIELRAYVIGNDVVSVVARIQPYAIGDGKSRLGTLVQNLHEARKVNYRATKMPVVVDWEFVSKRGHDANSVPSDGEIVFLNPFSLPNVGAFVVDVTGSVCAGIIDIARRAKDAIPMLEMAGVDILVEDLKDEGTAYVLEVNTSAALDLHRYPTHGNPRAIDKDIVDYFHDQLPKKTIDV